MRAQRIEPRLDGVAEQWVLVRGLSRRDFGPIPSLQGLHRRREEMTILHRHVMSLVLEKITNDGVDVMTKKLVTCEHAVDCLGDTA